MKKKFETRIKIGELDKNTPKTCHQPPKPVKCRRMTAWTALLYHFDTALLHIHGFVPPKTMKKMLANARARVCVLVRIAG